MTNDTRTQQYQYKDQTIDPTQFTTGGTASYDSSSFKNKYYNPHNPPYARIPNDASSGEKPNTNIQNIMAQRETFLATMMQNSSLMKVFGDTNLTAGALVAANLSGRTDSNSGDKDEMMSGNFIISRICHDIAGQANSPKYVCNMELLKGNRNESV